MRQWRDKKGKVSKAGRTMRRFDTLWWDLQKKYSKTDEKQMDWNWILTFYSFLNCMALWFNVIS